MRGGAGHAGELPGDACQSDMGRLRSGIRQGPGPFRISYAPFRSRTRFSVNGSAIAYCGNQTMSLDTRLEQGTTEFVPVKLLGGKFSQFVAEITPRQAETSRGLRLHTA